MLQSCENCHFVCSKENGISSVITQKDVFLKGKKRVFQLVFLEALKKKKR